MAKFKLRLDGEIKCALNCTRAPAFCTVCAPRAEFAHFCRYSCVLYDIIK